MLFAAGFIVFQQIRERQYKVELFNTRLQDFNRMLYVDELENGQIQDSTLQAYVNRRSFKGMRVTLIKPDGRVVFDSKRKDYAKFTNHKSRPEVRQALSTGLGYSVDRNSTTTSGSYFYSATYIPKIHLVVRSAIPYDNDVVRQLTADSHFLWFALFAVILLTWVLYRFIHRLGQNISGVFSAGSLREKNEELSRRNRELQEENRKLRLREDDTQDLEALKKALRYKGGSDTEQLISGDVTAMNDSRWIRTFTINLGKEDGVKTGSVVVNGDGLVGTVKSAGRGWAKVSTILDSSRGISFCLEDSRKTMGILHVSTDGELEGYMLDESAKVRAGDTLVTSGMGVYPERITVGKVKKVTNDEEEKLKRITVETAVQFDGLRKVAVLL